jgi:hypothetical protein
VVELASFVWSVANTLTSSSSPRGWRPAGRLDVERATTLLLIGAVIWSYLAIIFEILTETAPGSAGRGRSSTRSWRRWGRPVHLLGVGLFAVYGVVRTGALFAVVALCFGLHFAHADLASALVLLAVASVSFVGVGGSPRWLPLIWPEKAQLGFIAQRFPLVVSGVYYRWRSCPSGCSGWPSSRPPPTRCAGSEPPCSTAGWARRGATCGRCWCSAQRPSRSASPCSGRASATPKRHGKLKRSGSAPPQHRRLARQSSGVEAGDELARLDRLPPRASPTIAATQPHEALPTSSKSRVSGARTGCDGAC